MPELPEVETTCRGISPHIESQTVSQVIVRQPKLRWPVSPELSTDLPQQRIQKVSRRAKYILISTGNGTLIIHLGMSGSLRIIKPSMAIEKHDHVDILFHNGVGLRYTDPRRFGCLLWTAQPIEEHKLIASLGPEPLTDNFHDDYFQLLAKSRRVPIKTFIMDGHVVVGVGNIYASESLFLAGIHPTRLTNNISAKRLKLLLKAIKEILTLAIEQGGTTLKDFVNSDGKPGYFQQTLAVYGRKNQPCHSCNTPIKQIVIGQRSTFYCPKCQR